MPVFTKNAIKVLYVHVPRTAGSSVQKYFETNGYEVSYFDEGARNLYKGLCASQHIEAKLILEEFDLSEFQYIFSVFRDPVERLVSEYKWRCSEGGERYPDFPYWVEWIFRCYEENNYVNDNHIRPQHEFYFEECEVFDFNDISNLPQKLSDRIGLELSRELGKENSSSFSFSMDEKCLNHIRDFYKKDYVWRENHILS
jgi:hypothetical protein